VSDVIGMAWALLVKVVRVFYRALVNDHKNQMDDIDLVRVILKYLESHPHAADSAEGVARWWLDDRSAEVTLPEVESALRELVVRQALREEKLVDGTTLYSKN
jgi:hypothetical protein